VQTRIIAVANQKGGVGKTTTAVNLSACLAERRRRILLVDLDPQANATSGLGLEKAPGASIYAPLLGERPAAECVRPTEIRRLDIIPAEVDLAGAEVDIARTNDYLHRLRRALEPLAETGNYDYIFVDCPPSLGILTMNALAAADSILIPMQCEYYALEGLSVMLGLVQRISAGGANSGLELEGIVMTMYDTRTNLSQQVVSEVVTHFGDKVFETLIPRTVRLSEAPSFGKPVIAYDRRCTGAAAYRQLAREFLQRRSLAAATEAVHSADNPPTETNEALSPPPPGPPSSF